MNIKAIPTYYNNYKFRSLLEARWAFFFDKLGIDYRYELQGYDLDGIWYLPDFYLPEGHLFGDPLDNRPLWVETKPSLNLQNKDRQKVRRFVEKKGDPLLLVGGDPDPSTRLELLVANEDRSLDSYEVFWAQFSDIKINLVLPRKENGVAIKPSGYDPLGKHLVLAFQEAKSKRFSSSPVKGEGELELRKCKDCNTEFIPRYHKHTLCDTCFRDRMTVDMSGRDQEEQGMKSRDIVKCCGSVMSGGDPFKLFE